MFKSFGGAILLGLAIGVGISIGSHHDTLLDRLRGYSLSKPGSHAAIVRRVAPAVVNIYNARSSPQPMAAGVQHHQRQLSSLGSGVIVSSAGYVLTSYHVIAGADDILISLADGREAVAAFIGADVDTDLALVKISLPDLPYLPLSRTIDVEVGDTVIAIGNSLGLGQTVTSGIVSATSRSNIGVAAYENLIQTDAAITRGNSGGALVDTRGNLVGINSAILSLNNTWQGVGFSIPTSIAYEVTQSLIQDGKVVRGWLGVTVDPVSPDLLSYLGINSTNGCIVTALDTGGPADSAGLRYMDVLVDIDGTAIRDGRHAMNMIAAYRPGAQLELGVIRNKVRETVTVTVGTRPNRNVP